MVLSQNCRHTHNDGLGGDRHVPVTAPPFQTSCFQTSHAQQHSVRYASCSGSAERTYAAAPCDFNWMIRCNSISDGGAARVSVRRKPKEHWWLEPLSSVSFLLGWITRPLRPLVSTPVWIPHLQLSGSPISGTLAFTGGAADRSSLVFAMWATIFRPAEITPPKKKPP